MAVAIEFVFAPVEATHIASPGIVHMHKVAVLAADLNIDLRYSHEKIHKYQILPGDDDKEMDEVNTICCCEYSGAIAGRYSAVLEELPIAVVN